MIQFNNVSVRLGRQNVVENVSFCVDRGEICVILGQNGSGKTTLLKAVSSNAPYTGCIMADGRDISALGRRERATTIAFMAQNLPSPPVSVERLVSFGRRPYTGISGILSPEDKLITHQVLRQTGLEHISEKRVDRISGGEKRKAFFAMMLCRQSPYILADEPTANLDVIHAKSILEMLAERKAAGDGVITVLHDINQALEIADKILLMDSGHAVFFGSPRQFCEKNFPFSHFGMERLECTGSDGKKQFIYR